MLGANLHKVLDLLVGDPSNRAFNRADSGRVELFRRLLEFLAAQPRQRSMLDLPHTFT
jgi:hypothetical protein